MLTWIPDVLRAAGLVVVEWPGWEIRGRDAISVNGVVCHHTATGPGTSNEAVAQLLEKGRIDLPGPLSQLGLDRDGHYWMIAAGRSNHNGYGTWGNDSIGVEAFNDGRGEPWTAVQMESFARGCAALIGYLGLSIAEVRGHKETDPTRKIDPLFDMDAFRAQVASHLPPTSEEDDMQPFWIKVGTDPKGAFALPDGRVIDRLTAEEKSSLDAVFMVKAANQRQVDVVQNRINN